MPSKITISFVVNASSLSPLGQVLSQIEAEYGQIIEPHVFGVHELDEERLDPPVAVVRPHSQEDHPGPPDPAEGAPEPQESQGEEPPSAGADAGVHVGDHQEEARRPGADVGDPAEAGIHQGAEGGGPCV